MPTTYTAPVIDGQITELHEFVEVCLRAFNCCRGISDTPFALKLPDNCAISAEYYINKAAELEVELNTFLGLSEINQHKAFEAYAIQCYDTDLKNKAEADEKAKRIDSMYNNVLHWSPPHHSELAELRQFMLEQLRMVRSEGDFHPTHAEHNYNRWREAYIRDLSEQLERCRHEIARIVAANVKSAAFIKLALAASQPGAPGVPDPIPAG